MRTAGPKYLSAFHQYEGQEVEQHAHKMHWRFTKSMVSVSECFRWEVFICYYFCILRSREDFPFRVTSYMPSNFFRSSFVCWISPCSRSWFFVCSHGSMLWYYRMRHKMSDHASRKDSARVQISDVCAPWIDRKNLTGREPDLWSHTCVVMD